MTKHQPLRNVAADVTHLRKGINKLLHRKHQSIWGYPNKRVVNN